MTSEEMERAMQFILEQQPQLTTTVGRLSEKVDRTADSVNALLVIAEIHDREIREIGESVRVVDERQRAADERQREANERQREADERGRQTDERLNALINTVERIISERKNGKS